MNPFIDSSSPRAIALNSLKPGPKGSPDAYGFALTDDTRIIICFDAEESHQRGLQRVGQVFSGSSDRATQLCVSWQGCVVDLRTIEWFDDLEIECMIAASKGVIHRGINPSAPTFPSSERSTP